MRGMHRLSPALLLGLPFTILDANERVGDSWRARWDSLRLFTPARHNGLDGLPFPAARHSFPRKDEMADYLETYAARFELVEGVMDAGTLALAAELEPRHGVERTSTPAG